MKVRTIRKTIKGAEWTFNLLGNRQYEKKHGTDSDAITISTSRVVDIRTEGLSPETVRHELMHIYVTSSLVASSNLDPAQMEELCAEIVGTHGIQICMFADDITNYFLMGDE